MAAPVTTRYDVDDLVSRRSRLRWVPTGIAVLACACAPTPATPPAPPPVPLHLEPACDLAPSAGLSWIVDARPRAIAEVADLIVPISLVLPEERLERFAAAHGGVDLRQVKELCVARYEGALLSIARTPIDAEKVAAAFEDRSPVPARRAELAPNPRVVRLTSELGSEPRQLALFGREALALEEGAPGPLRAAEAFAFKKLKRSRPALRGAALSRAAEVLGDAPVRAFAPGPFEGEAAEGLGGLLRAATAVGASATWAGTGTNIAVRVVLTGAWGDDATAAAERLGAAAHVLAESATGRFFGLHRPAEAPRVRAEADALVLEAVLDGATLARGLRDALDAEITEIMGQIPPPSGR